MNFRFLKLHFRFGETFKSCWYREKQRNVSKSMLHVQSCCSLKMWCTCRVVVLLIKPFVVLTFCWRLSSTLYWGKSLKCLLLINPSILLNNLMLVILKNLGKTVLRLILLYLVLPVCLALYLDSCQRLLKLTSQMQQSVKKWNKVKIPLRNTCYNIQATQQHLWPT